jgi:GntR family transcriptional regulator, transcriptional repressor for pyruvate dehydrogenase complex
LKKIKLSNLRPIEYLTQVDKIEISLQEFFRKGNYLPGDPVPKEMELAEAMGVSRTAIREAISRFKVLGIIESKKNRGMVLTRPDILNNMVKVLDTRLLDGDTMKEIFEMRLVIEMGIGDILFLRKTPAGIGKLEEIVAREEKTKNKTELIKCDIEFHSVLYEISGNITLLRFQNMLLPIFNYVNSVPYPSNTGADKDQVTHKMLLNALKSGTPEEFRNKMRKHLANYFQQI